MAKNFDDAYEVQSGLSIDGQGGIFMGYGNPWDEPVLGAPIGSRYWKLSNEDEQFRKIGAGDLPSDWKKITRADLGAPPLTLSWTSFNAKPLDYLDIGKITSNKVSQSVPFDTSIIALTVSYETIGTGGATIELWINDLFAANLGTLSTAATPGVQNFGGLNIFVGELSRIQLRMAAGSAQVNILVANLILEDLS